MSKHILELRECWRELTAWYSAPQAVKDNFFDELISAYSEPHRKYHIAEHCWHVVKGVLEYRRQGRVYNLPAALFAALYHDFFYDVTFPTYSENEARSADKCVSVMEVLNVNFHTKIHARDMVRATKGHKGNDTDTLSLLSADLAILGKNRETYMWYASAIREEFSWVPTELYVENRIKAMTAFLQKDCIIPFDEKANIQAYENIKYEINSLQTKSLV